MRDRAELAAELFIIAVLAVLDALGRHACEAPMLALITVVVRDFVRGRSGLSRGEDVQRLPARRGEPPSESR